MKKNTKFICLFLLALVPVACSIYPGQLFVGSGVTGNGCCGTKTVVVITKEADGQKVIIDPEASGSASPTVKPSASVSPVVSVSSTASPSATASPVPSASPSPSPVVTATPSPIPS